MGVFFMIFQQAMFGNGSTYWSNKSLPPKGVSRFISVSTYIYIYIYIYMVCHQNSKGVLMQPVESDVNPGIDPLAVYLGLVPGFGLISFHYWNGRKQVGFHQGLPPSPHPSTPSFWDMYILRMSKKPAHHIHTYLHLPPLSLPVCTSRDIAKRCR